MPLRPRIFSASPPLPQPTCTIPHPQLSTFTSTHPPISPPPSPPSTATTAPQRSQPRIPDPFPDRNLPLADILHPALSSRTEPGPRADVRSGTEGQVGDRGQDLEGEFQGFHGFDFRKKNSRLAKKEKKQKADLALCINLQAVVGLCQGFGAITTGGPTGDAGLADGFRGMQIGQGGGVMMTQDAQPGGYAQG